MSKWVNMSKAESLLYETDEKICSMKQMSNYAVCDRWLNVLYVADD